jgi:hypothetical protein
VVWFFLTDREARAGSKHQTHYVTDPHLAEVLGAGDSEVQKSAIAFAEARELAGGAGVAWGDVEQHTRSSGDAWETEALVVHDGAATLALRFTPPLPDLRLMPEGSARSAWSFRIGEQGEVAGEIDVEKHGGVVSVHFRPQSPRGRGTSRSYRASRSPRTATLRRRGPCSEGRSNPARDPPGGRGRAPGQRGGHLTSPDRRAAAPRGGA